MHIKNIKIKLRKGFSLVEMLMALLVASLLLAALAPVITRKMYTENLHITSTNNNLQEVERMVKCLRTSDEIKLEDIAFSDNRVTFLLVSGGGGGGGASGTYKSSIINLSTPTVSSTAYSSKVLNLNKNMTDFELETLIGGGGGGGGGTFTTTGNADYCKNLGNGKTDTTGRTGTLSKPILVYNSKANQCVSVYDQYGSGECRAFTGTNNMQVYCCSYSGAVAACNLLSTNIGAGKFSIPNINEAATWGGGIGSFMFTNPPNGADGHGYAKDSSSPYYPNNAIPTDETNKIAVRAGSFWTSTPHAEFGNQCMDNLAVSVMHFYVRESNKLWLEGGANCVLGFYNGYKQYATTRCVITPFVSFSGGGGGGAAGIMGKDTFNSEVKTLFKNTIKDNLENGSILIEAGKGGDKGLKGTNGTDASAGGNGGESCVSVYSGKNSSGTRLFKVCAPGGNGGKGAIASLNYKNGSSYYAAGGASMPSNSCYYINSSGSKFFFNCTQEGSLGEHGYGSESKMETTWGHGGASPLNLSTFASTNAINGTTLNSITYAGSGGSGGRANTNNGTNTAGDGGAGASGLVKITYKNKKDGSGGGGGAGGNAVKISNIIFNKSYYDCKITVGQGGSGGNAGSTQNNGTALKGDDGTPGGNSSVTCDGGNTIFTVLGANGGKGGIGATASANSIGGAGGVVLNSSNATSGKLEGLKPAMIYLVTGKQGNTPDSASINAVKIGGAGGKSGTNALGGCGGTDIDDDAENGCITLSQTSPDGKGFKNDDVSDAYQFYGSNITTAWQNIVQNSAPSFGTAGAGGGGGSYIETGSIGKGGNGMGGYVCVFYTRAKK